MGVEYFHALLVRDTEWLPTWKHAEAIDAVLAKAGFKRNAFYELGQSIAPIDEVTARAMPANLLIAYATLQGAKVRTLVGPNESGIDDKHRYIMTTSLHLATDYKILQAEGYEVTITTAPKNGRKRIQSEFAPRGYPVATELFRSTRDTTRPRTDGKPWDRVWRCGVIFDCHKDIPSMAADAKYELPNRAFVRDLEKAFGTKLVEVGWFS